MKYKKGDLIAIKTLDGKRVTGVVKSILGNGQFLHCYIIENCKHKLIYDREVEYTITDGFESVFEEEEPEPFDLDYSFYQACDDFYVFSAAYPFFSDDDSSEDEE